MPDITTSSHFRQDVVDRNGRRQVGLSARKKGASKGEAAQLQAALETKPSKYAWDSLVRSFQSDFPRERASSADVGPGSISTPEGIDIRELTDTTEALERAQTRSTWRPRNDKSYRL